MTGAPVVFAETLRRGIPDMEERFQVRVGFSRAAVLSVEKSA
jgi:hypothetical protein